MIDSVSSGERKRISLNLVDVKLQGVVNQVSWDSAAGILKFRRKEILSTSSGTVWKDWLNRVIAPYAKSSGTSRSGIPSIAR